MKDFIGFTRKILFMNQGDSLPDPPIPAPPGPYDRSIPAVDGLNAYSTPYNSPTGIMVVRGFFTNNAASIPTLDIKWNGVAMTQVPIVANATPGDPVLFLAAIKGGATGTHNLTIDVTSGSVGKGFLRIGDLAAMDTDWIGQVQSGIADTQIVDVFVVPTASGSSVAQIAGFIGEQVWPITEYQNATIQWATYREDSIQKVLNGDFATDADWTKGGGWTISGGQARRQYPGNSSLIQKGWTLLDPAKVHRVSFNFVQRGAIGNISLAWTNAAGTGIQTFSQTYTAQGIYSLRVYPPNNTGGLMITGIGNNNTSAATIVDDVSVVEEGTQNAVMFATQPQPGPQQYTYEANAEGTAGWLTVEIKGLVLP